MLATKKEFEPRDILVVTSTDGSAEIATIVNIDEERILGVAGGSEYAVPVGDAKAFTGRRGRIFIYPSTMENVMDCQRIAALERSVVLRQITHFEKERQIQPIKLPTGKIMIIVAVIVLMVILIATLK